MGDNVKVAVRMRPFNGREKEMKAERCIRMLKETNQTVITDPETGKDHNFTFDFSYDSFDPSADNYCSQQTVWEDIGVGVLKSAWEGYNVSLFAYGQTGSGKSYSMMGYPPTPLNPGSGIIPIACSKIFETMSTNENPDLTIKVECSMLEIYMEKVRDLFNPKAGYLKVRNHPKIGFYVQDLSRNAVTNFDQVEKMMDAGSKARTIASTNMNATSSRAHTIFQIQITQTQVDRDAGKATDKVSLINLIDLAGSERAGSTGATGDTLKQGAAINQSLSALGNVISALAKASESKAAAKQIPYRSSVLTQLLKNSLGGNAKTIMIAALSPASVNYSETLSTLRYADRAKQIKNKATVNEDPNVKLIKNLRAEIEALRKALEGGGVDMAALMAGGGAAAAAAGGGGMSEEDKEALRKQFEQEKEAEMRKFREEIERLEREKNQSWEDKLKESEERALALMGLQGNAEADAERKKTTPHLTNLHEDIQLNHQIVHFLEEGDNLVGRKSSADAPRVVLGGLSIQRKHCNFRVDGGQILLSVFPHARVHVNGRPVADSQPMRTYDRVIIGNHHVFVFVNPHEEAPEGLNVDEIDWEWANKEVNADQINALTAGGGDVAGGEESAAMEAKLRELEERMRQEREEAAKQAEQMAKAHEESVARDAELKLEEQQRKMQELQEQLNKQREETQKLQARKRREAQERTLLDDLLLKTIPLVNEANLISDELGKGMRFSIKLLAKSKFGASGAQEPAENKLAVRTEMGSGADAQEAMWTYNQFVDRLYAMRELYQRYEEADDDPTVLDDVPPDEDPFRAIEADVLVGKALVFLEPLGYLVDVDERVPIIDYRGMEKGQLVVTITPQALDFEDQPLDMDDLEEDMLNQYMGRNLDVRVRIQAARGLPPHLVSRVYVAYRWFVEEDARKTEVATGRTINPKFEYDETIRQVVTEDFANWAGSDMLVFEVFGKHDPEGAAARPVTSMARRTNRSRAATGGGPVDSDDEAKEGSGAEDEVAALRAQLRDTQRKYAEEQERNRKEVSRLKETGGLTEDESVACSVQ